MNPLASLSTAGSLAHFPPPGLPAWQAAVASVSGESLSLSRRLATLVDEVDCGLVLMADDRTLYANHAARRILREHDLEQHDCHRLLVPQGAKGDGGAGPSPRAGGNGNAAPAVMTIVPLGQQADGGSELTLVLLGKAHLCQDLCSRFDAILHEVEQCLLGVRECAQTDRMVTTLLFTDIVESTRKAEYLGDEHWRRLLAQYHAIVRGQLGSFRGREIDAAGDGFFATFEAPARAIRCAQAIRATVKAIGLDIRAGLHTGECEVVGSKVIGVAVHVAARVVTSAAAGEILVSSTVRELVAGSGLRFSDGAMHVLRGLHDRWRLYALLDDA